MYKKLARNPYFVFLPFLFYYGYLIIKSKWPKLYGDEIRYAEFAHNLLHGFYSPPAPHINLWNGPGYPMVLAPFEALNIPDIYITLMNALFLYLAIVFLYKALNLIANYKVAVMGGVLLGMYPGALSVLPIMYTEAFTGFLMSLFIYSVTLCYFKGGVKYRVFAGLVLGFLALTKIIFGYVILISFAACLLLLLFKHGRFYYRKSVYILLVAFAVTVPYLAYTWHLTGKVLYWGNSGGMSLYWMSTPFAHEYGDWKLPNLSNSQYPTLFKSTEGKAFLRRNHFKEMKFILAHNEIEQDELFKKAAINNIKKDPQKFVNNYFDNFSRMLFNYPYSYAYQDDATVGNILSGSLILWLGLIGILLTVVNWRYMIFPVKLALMVTAIYLMLSTALSAYPRQLDVIMPVLLFWMGFLFANIKSIDVRFRPNAGQNATANPGLSAAQVYNEEPVAEVTYHVE